MLVCMSGRRANFFRRGQITYANSYQTNNYAQSGKYTSSAPAIPPIWTVSTNYYVDCVNGLDTTSGVSTLLPWKTLSHALTALGSTAAGTAVNLHSFNLLLVKPFHQTLHRKQAPPR